MSKFLELEAKCPCGKDGRYFNIDKIGNQVMSCNKYSVCPTYDELEQTYKELLFNYGELLDAAGDVVIFREIQLPARVFKPYFYGF